MTPTLQEIHPSALERRRKCPGSRDAERGIEDQVNEAAVSGTRIHDALEEAINLESLQLDDLNAWCEEIAERRGLDENETFIVCWFARIIQKSAIDNGGAKIVDREVGVRYQIAEGIILKGRIDLRLWMENGTLHIYDYKTGRAAQDTADDNSQIQAYAVATFDALSNPQGEELAVNSVTAHIIAAGNEKEERHTYSTFAVEHLAAYKENIREIAIATTDPDAPREPGWPQCQYCRARGTKKCPESRAYLERFAKNVAEMSDPQAVFGDLDPSQRCSTLDFSKAVAAIADRIQKAAKTMLREEPDAIEHWYMTPDGTTKEIGNTIEAIALLEKEGMLTRDQVIASAKLSRTALATAYYHSAGPIAEATGEKRTTKSASSTIVDSILEPVMREKDRSGSLRRDKK